MDPQMYISGKRCKTIKTCATPSSSSNYSTCSDNPIANINFNENSMHISTQSEILAGQMPLNDSLTFSVPSFEINDTHYLENILDQNLDVIVESDDVFADCNDDNILNCSESDSTTYIPLESVSKLQEMKSDAPKLPIEQDRLITIMEESEVTTHSMVKNSPSVNVENTTGGLVVDMISHLKKCEQINDCNKNITKKVLFANENNIINTDENYKKTNEIKLKGQKRTPNSMVRKNRSYAEKKNINGNYDCHNTTESFIKWERLCQNSQKLNSRRSFSHSELSCLTESYGGDDEYSTSFKTLDDTFVSNYSIDTIGNKSNLQGKFLLHKSKSCDFLPKEDKHLPHVVYDFLKTLSKAIEYLKKQTVVCTCEHCIHNQKHSDKQNNNRNLNIGNKPIKIIDEIEKVVKVKHLSEVAPLKIVTNEEALSPEALSKNSSKSTKKLNAKGSPSIPKLSVKRLYSWHKEIKSPVGEYIKGKGTSPFKNSPTRKKE